ncbi:MAG TPA: hypothetical protein VM425_03230 [Myxococcota bacterium]|nr:hypothetical protein [Myxococcota bacterium]
MSKQEPVLQILLKGGRADEHRISIDSLTDLLKKVQLCVKRVGLSLVGKSAEAKPGRIKGDVEAACSLEVVAINPGSFGVALALSPDQEPETTLFGTKEPLGQEAVAKFVEGVALLGQETPKLVNEFDYGVLASLRDAAKVLNRGYTSVEFLSQRRGRRPAKAVLDARVARRVEDNISGPIKSAVVVKGTLREVDLEKQSCRIYPSAGGKYIQCAFEELFLPLMKELLDSYVSASGEATHREADGRIRELRIKDIERLDLEALPLFPQVDAKPKTGRELLRALRASGLVGIWKDRDAIGDSSTFARKLRKRAQTRTEE